MPLNSIRKTMIIINNTLQVIFISLVFIGLSSGSAFWALSASFKPSILLPLIALPFLFLSFRPKINLISGLLLFYIFIAILHNFAYGVRDSFIDLFYISYIYLVFLAAQVTANLLTTQKNSQTYKTSLIFFLTVTLLILAYFYEIKSGVSLVGKTNDFGGGIYSSTFNNVNDFASYIAIVTPLLLYFVDKYRNSSSLYISLYLFLCLIIFLLASRTALLAILLIPVAYMLFRAKFIQSLLLVLLILILSQLNWEEIIYSLTKVDNEIISRSASRVSLALYDFESDNSASYRLDSYYHFFNNIFETVIGTGTKNYAAFYGEKFSGTVVGANPHSFFIEITLAFGWLGLTTIVAIFTKLIFNIYRMKKTMKLEYFYGMTSLIIFILISNVPSTIIRLPILFFPIFFFYCLSKTNKCLKN